MELKDLRIYQIASRLRQEVYQETSHVQHNWKNDDVKQIKRAAASVAANIAEGYSRKYYNKDLIRFLSIALGSSDECQNHIIALFENGYISKEKTDYFKKNFKDLSIRILNFRNFIYKKPNR
jgi:four helix bundle protein